MFNNLTFIQKHGFEVDRGNDIVYRSFLFYAVNDGTYFF